VVFNASLHYSTDYALTLSEALRVLRPDGRVVILDSPVYHDPSSGRRMVHEREAQFRATYGFASNALASEHFLTPARLDALAAELGLAWQRISPWYGLAWATRPWRARLRGQREPASFGVIVGARR
jgi:SAM-dependent methyltransferase